jgi:hypothetical protein
VQKPKAPKTYDSHREIFNRAWVLLVTRLLCMKCSFGVVDEKSPFHHVRMPADISKEHYLAKQ